MGTSWSDAAAGGHDAERTDAALAHAFADAEAIATRFSDDWAANPLRPDVSVDLDVGGDEQPLFVFSVNVDLDDDLDANDYPLDALEELASALRARVSDSTVTGWAWLVTIGTKAGAAH